jgi:endonuclease/exonuclease/phosphatase family metal-dependent hydrolase
MQREGGAILVVAMHRLAARIPRLVLSVAVIVLALAGCWYGSNRVLSSLRCLRLVESPAPSSPAPPEGTLTIAAFNIAHGCGSHRPLWDPAGRQAVVDRVTRIGRLLRARGVDIAVLNEVDFSSVRSAHVDQAALLAEVTGLGYRLEQRNVDMALPFVRNRYGNLLLSRFPIVEAHRLDLPGHSWWETALIGKKQAAVCTVGVGPELSLRVLAVHLDHRSEELRLRSVELIDREVRTSLLPLVAAGDFNCGPTAGQGTEGSGERPSAVAWLLGRGGLRAARWPDPGPEGLTSPADRPTRAIDWVLVPPPWTILSAEVLDVRLSDHRPVVLEVRPAGV